MSNSRLADRIKSMRCDHTICILHTRVQIMIFDRKLGEVTPHSDVILINSIDDKAILLK